MKKSSSSHTSALLFVPNIYVYTEHGRVPRYNFAHLVEMQSLLVFPDSRFLSTIW